MCLPRIFTTASFRFATLYVALFAGSVMVLGTVVYFTTRSTLNQQLQNRIETEVSALRGLYRARDLDALVAAVHQREQVPSELDYRVENASGQLVAGSLPPPGDRRGWVNLKTQHAGSDNRDSDSEQIYAQAVALNGGALLVVGDDRDRIYQISEAILDAFQWTLSLTILLGIGGGLILSMGFLRRIDAITRTAEAIIDGDLSQRIPMRKQSDEIDRLAQTLNRMLDRINALIESLRQVSNDIAHDLRTPLTHLRQRLEAARDQARSPVEYQTAIDTVMRETDELLETFNALLRIAQIEAGTRRAGFADVDLGEVMYTVVDAFRPSAEQAGQCLTVSTPKTCRFDGDRELLIQMLANLIDNAVRHTPPGTTTMLAVAPTVSGWQLVIADNGPGVPATERDHILTRFYRLENSRAMPGNGLGLSLVAAVVELHGGRITLEDNNPGLRIMLVFPSDSTHRPAAQNGAHV